MPIFYTLPAHQLVEGLSTDDGQDIVDVLVHGTSITATVYTPRPDDPDADAYNRATPEGRIYGHDELVDLAVFDDTVVDLSRHPSARERVER